MSATNRQILDFEGRSKFSLLVDLHSNSATLSKLAQEAGADGVILHINESPSQGARFGGLEIEEDSIKECFSSCSLPFGIGIGDARPLVPEDWERCLALGFSFVNMFAHHMPTFVWKDERITKVVSLGPGYILEQIRAISDFKEFSAFVSAFTPGQGFGSPLNVLDAATLKLITGLAKKPVLFPTQRLVRKEDVQLLRTLGVHGLILTNQTYGNTPDELGQTIRDFKNAIAASSPQSARK